MSKNLKNSAIQMKKRIVCSQRSTRYQRFSRAARNNEDDSNSMRSLSSRVVVKEATTETTAQIQIV